MSAIGAIHTGGAGSRFVETTACEPTETLGKIESLGVPVNTSIVGLCQISVLVTKTWKNRKTRKKRLTA